MGGFKSGPSLKKGAGGGVAGVRSGHSLKQRGIVDLKYKET